MRRLLPVILALAAASSARADDDFVFLGAGIARNSIKDITATNSDLNSTSWKAFAGLRPINLFAVEADYIDLGSQTSSFLGNTVHLQYEAFAGYAVGFVPLPVPYLDVFGKIGLARWSSSGSNASVPNGFFSLSENGTEFAWGIGTQVHFGSVGARLEYESFNIPNTEGANVVSLEVMFLF
jgi:outer membrane protein with beta-barrel domain